MVTAATYQKEHCFRSRMRLRHLTQQLMDLAGDYRWSLEAWAVFSNHYHFIGKSPPDSAANLSTFLGTLHRRTSTWLNRLDDAVGRKVWHNYRETELTFQRSYLARLHYVICNPVHHGLVPVADQYPWCSAAWFKARATPAFQKTVLSFPIDRLEIDDDF